MNNISPAQLDKLTVEATLACELSHSPYSKEHKNLAGAAVLTDKGIFRGAQFENCAFPNTICAPHAAFLNAISSGATRFDGLVVVAHPDASSPEPCGSCLQTAKLFGDIPVWTLKQGEVATSDNYKMLEQLLPTIFADKKKQPFFNGYRLGLSVPDLRVTGSAPPNTVTQEEYEKLCKAAVKACETSWPVYSDFPVGAAFLTETGDIITGGNIESDYLRLTICAERCGMCKAVAQGVKKFKALAVCCYKLDDYGRPCGGCRQNLVEFGDYPIFQCKVNASAGTIEVEPNTTLGILPNAFYPADVNSLLT